MKISAIVLTKNEEKNINDSLDSISFCDEVIVIDDYSSDKTVDIARKHGAKVIKRALGGNFTDQRNFALSIAKKGFGKWGRGVHEKLIINGKISDFIYPIVHYPHQNLSDFIGHIDYFSGLHADANFKEGKKSSLLKIVIMPVAHLLKNFIIKMGFIDGIVGFNIAVLMSLHSFLAWSKLFILQ